MEERLCKPKIGFLSFTADKGHVIPLLRMAQAFAENQYQVVGYFPEENRELTASYHIPIRLFGRVNPAGEHALFATLSKQTIFTNAFSAYYQLMRRYFLPIKLAVAKNLQSLHQMIAMDNVSLLIVDSHIYNDWMITLAASLKIPLILHYSEGNCRYLQRPFVVAYGITNHHELTQTMIELLGFIYQKCCHGWLMSRTRTIRRQIDFLYQRAFPLQVIHPVDNDSTDTYPPDNYPSDRYPKPPLHITTGIAVLEQKMLQKGIETTRDNILKFPPIADHRIGDLSESVQKWLDDNQDKPIVYISLGTIVQAEKSILRKILLGVKDLEAGILWSAPREQIQLLQEMGLTPNIKAVEFISQPQILAREQVRCFINHGGAGGVQESLLSGKPMLCIPFMFDQPYNSSIIQQLQVGIKFKKNELSPRAIHDAVWSLLHDQRYWNTAQNVMKQLSDIDGAQAIIHYLQAAGILPASAAKEAASGQDVTL